jgi:hypothetical protein
MSKRNTLFGPDGLCIGSAMTHKRIHCVDTQAYLLVGRKYASYATHAAKVKEYAVTSLAFLHSEATVKNATNLFSRSPFLQLVSTHYKH